VRRAGLREGSNPRGGREGRPAAPARLASSPTPPAAPAAGLSGISSRPRPRPLQIHTLNPLPPQRYRKLLLGVDLTRHFYFSYSYRLTHTLQRNHTDALGGGSPAGGDGSPAGGGGGGAGASGPAGLDVFEGSMFAWNAHLTRPLRAAAGSARWTVALVHGFWEQRQVGAGQAAGAEGEPP
jgi:hypothetical protein